MKKFFVIMSLLVGLAGLSGLVHADSGGGGDSNGEGTGYILNILIANDEVESPLFFSASLECGFNSFLQFIGRQSFMSSLGMKIAPSRVLGSIVFGKSRSPYIFA